MQNNIISKIINTPLLIKPSQVDNVFATMAIDNEHKVSSSLLPEAAGGSVAVIPICGVLSHRSSGLFSFVFGETANYERIGQQFHAALNDDSVDTIVFDVDSPGGVVAGAFDLADEIHQARGIKPIVAIVNECALSAAYLLASAADKVYLSRTADAGGIGIIVFHCDQSEAEKAAGLNYTAIYAGDRKNDFTPHEPLSKEAYQEAKQKIDSTYDLFVSTVARNRGLSPQTIIDTQAAIYSGSNAVEVGLADGVMSFNYAIEQLLTSGGNMGLKTDIRKLLAGKDEAEIKEAMESLGYVPSGSGSQFDPDKMRKIALSGISEIMGMCELAGIQDIKFVKKLISDGVSVAEAQDRILEAKADQSDQNEIFSTVGATTTGEQNPVLAEATRRSGAK